MQTGAAAPVSLCASRGGAANFKLGFSGVTYNFNNDILEGARAMCSLHAVSVPAPRRRRRFGRYHVAGIGLGLVAAAAAHAAASHDDDVERLKQLGPVVPLEQVIDQARARQPGRLLEAEVDDDYHGKVVYEIEILDAQGRVWELHFDVKTGALIEREEKQR